MAEVKIDVTVDKYHFVYDGDKTVKVYRNGELCAVGKDSLSYDVLLAFAERIQQLEQWVASNPLTKYDHP